MNYQKSMDWEDDIYDSDYFRTLKNPGDWAEDFYGQ